VLDPVHYTSPAPPPDSAVFNVLARIAAWGRRDIYSGYLEFQMLAKRFVAECEAGRGRTLVLVGLGKDIEEQVFALSSMVREDLDAPGRPTDLERP
jgi:hypothetical protein